MPQYEKAKDVFIQRKNTSGGFEEYALIVRPNSAIITDENNNLVSISTASLISGTGSIDFAVSSSYAVTASYALNGGPGN